MSFRFYFPSSSSPYSFSARKIWDVYLKITAKIIDLVPKKKCID